MPEMREIFETVSRQAPPVLDALDRQVRRQRRIMRNRKVGAFTLAALFVGVVAAAFASRDPGGNGSIEPGPASSAAGGWIAAGTLADLSKEGVTYLEDVRVFVIVPPDGDPYALSAVSPHSPWGVEELLKYCRPFGGFRELEHGAQFDDHGDYMTGPASSGMYPVRTRTTSSDELQVRPFPVGAPSPRGTDDHENPTSFCGPGTAEVAPGMLDAGEATSPADISATRWFGPDDRPLAPATLSTFSMPFCRRWPPAILQLIEPLGTEPTADAVERVYVADPLGTWSDRVSTPYAQPRRLPPGAVFTGYRSTLFELWADPATFDEEVYLVRRDIAGRDWIQRLPRLASLPECLPLR